MENNVINYTFKWHGRGGQGAVTTAQITAESAFINGFKGVTASPFFGAERRGAPVMAFTRISSQPIRIFSQIEQADVVIIFDSSLLNVIQLDQDIGKDSLLIINTKKTPDIFSDYKIPIATVDAYSAASKAGITVSGQVIISTSILGAVIKTTGLFGMDEIEQALLHKFPSKLVQKNMEGVKIAMEATQFNDTWKRAIKP